MRLIDTDNFLKQYLDQIPGDTIDAIDLRLALLKEPKVEAIPVEWLREQIENPPYSHSWELGERWKGEYTTCLIVLLEDWEKKNGS